MRRAAAASIAALSLAALTACAEDAPEAGDGAGDPTWSVACAAGGTPIDGVGELELDCLGDGAPAAVGTDGKPLLVVLWATWCGPCQEEAPEIQAFYEAHGDQVGVLGVDTADSREAARWFAEDFALTYPSVSDPDEAIRIGLGIPALPGIAFVDADGTVAELVVEPGATTESLTATAESAFGLELP
ncbi:TlpA family protein disulfide reductase [Glycomyces harbinensis]|uniref:Thiol-disulfide isomerase or thioredoxin n=1 Tax=Glycomyces harbinensis TaxID=58114 RepID=A0A1G6ZBU0_9ACTN|nr:TlpA disulfide reductase family protein [Glycomyces harbinensis]SDE00129.1 Thiol-disulfide isomerase or thioredoxin [Glycomyces harbinensis]